MTTPLGGSPADPVDVVRRYLTAYAAGDAAAVSHLLHDDVAWVIHGHLSLTGRAAFLEEAARPGQAGLQVIAEQVAAVAGGTGPTTMPAGATLVLALGQVHVPQPDGADFTAAFADVFTVDGGLIARLESYVVPLTPASGGSSGTTGKE